MPFPDLQFIAADFAKLADEYGFTSTTTSPRYPQANGEIERTVQTVKNMLKKTREPQRALLALLAVYVFLEFYNIV